MKPAYIVACVALLAALLLSVQPAAAQVAYGDCDGCGSSYGPRWFGFFEQPYASGRIPTPPYFSIHPPVYYSYAMPRSYGYSPFAYPGTVRTPELPAEVAKAAVIINPFVKPELKEASSAESSEDRVAKRASIDNQQVAVRPQWVFNPFSRATPVHDIELTHLSD